MDFSKINLQDHQTIARAIVEQAISRKFDSRKAFEKFRNSLIKQHKSALFPNLYFIKAYEDLVSEGKISAEPEFLQYIQKRRVRTMSGVAPVTVMTKPFPCPGKCTYCPTDVRMPKSYLPSQPAAQRAFRQRFNPYTQVFVRLKALYMTGHEVSKVDLRVIGGTWSSYPKKYQTNFIKSCLKAMNEFPAKLKMEAGQEKFRKSKLKSPYGLDNVSTLLVKPITPRQSLAEVVKTNEMAAVRCIGINIETRPDNINQAEIKRLRHLGVTKVEIGVQTTDDHVQELTKRGHDLACVRQATELLKDSGFKISYHMMPNLPGSNPELDKKMIKEIFQNPAYQPDYLKIYPCVVLPRTALSVSFRKGEFKPYDDATLEDILEDNLKSIPEWCRLDRLARDIPANEIEAGTKISNIRQLIEARLRKQNINPRDIRFREVMDENIDLKNIKLVVRKYPASHGQEYFLSYEDPVKDKIIALLRLRLPLQTFLPELKKAALIREVHVYGQQVAVGDHLTGKKQHLGWGSRLMLEAEKLAAANGFKKMAVISGIGTREYYKKKGYKLIGTYMLKELKN